VPVVLDVCGDQGLVELVLPKRNFFEVRAAGFKVMRREIGNAKTEMSDKSSMWARILGARNRR
jgi:hypothetical protein